MLGVHEATVYRLINRGRLESVLVAGCRRVPDVSIDALLSSASAGPIRASEPDRSAEASRRRRIGHRPSAAAMEPAATK